jgi:hypothetical protein
VGLGTSAAVCYGPGLTEPIPEDMTIIESLSRHPNRRVRYNAFFGVGRIGGHRAYERQAIQVVLAANVDDSPALAEELCETFAPTRIRFEALSENDVRTILHKFVPVNELDDHWTTQFLDRAGRTYPAALFNFLVERIDCAAEKWARGESLGGYVPVTGHRIGGAFHSLQTGLGYSDFLVQVRDRYVAQPELQYWLEKIFWDIGTIDATTLSSIDDLLHTGDKEKVRAAVNLINGAPTGLALSRPYFAVHVLEISAEIDRNLLERASSTLITNAHVGHFSRTPGSPSPKFQQMEERAAASPCSPSSSRGTQRSWRSPSDDLQIRRRSLPQILG